MPPLPTLSKAAEVCLHGYIEAGERRRVMYALATNERQNSRITAIVHLPATTEYHTRLTRPEAESDDPLEYKVEHIRFTLKYDQESKQWVVDSSDGDSIGLRALQRHAVNIDDNVEQHDHSDHQTAQTTAVTDRPMDGGSKQAYIDLLACSEHEHNRCYRLLPAVYPLSVDTGTGLQPTDVPNICAIPLCASCRTLIARCIQSAHPASSTLWRSVWGVTRISSTIYEAAAFRDRHGNVYSSRVHIAYRGRAVQGEAEERGRVAGSERHLGVYEVVAHYKSAVYRVERNVCEQCRCGLTKSGSGHSEDCEQGRKRARV